MTEQTTQIAHPLEPFLRKTTIPHIWCPGCGDGIILNSFVTALKELEVNLDKIAVISGIGCIGRIAGYTNTDSFHTTHGRPIPFAVGVKLANPELNVIVISGDGDLFAIGGNHFIHAARRNIGIKVICSNNFNYGMTGGQQGPTTPLASRTATTPFGNIEHPFDLVHLAAASGAVYVARWTTLHVRRMTESIKKAIQKEGFSFIEIVSPCPEIYGKASKIGTAMDFMNWFKKASVIQNFSDPAQAEITAEKIPVGEFVDIEKPTFEKLLREMTAHAQGKVTGDA